MLLWVSLSTTVAVSTIVSPSCRHHRVKSIVGFCMFERVGFCELEVVLNWSEGQWTLGV